MTVHLALPAIDCPDALPATLSRRILHGLLREELGKALRQYNSNVDDFILSYAPNADEITILLERLQEYDMLIIGTLNAYASPNQAEFVQQALKLNIPSVVATLRLPYDLTVFPEAQAYVCTYSIF